jgi:hypothetical protein
MRVINPARGMRHSDRRVEGMAMGEFSSLFGRPQLPRGSAGPTTLRWGPLSPLLSAPAPKGRSPGSSPGQAGRTSAAISSRWKAAGVEVKQDAQLEDTAREASAALTSPPRSLHWSPLEPCRTAGIQPPSHRHSRRRRAESHRKVLTVTEGRPGSANERTRALLVVVFIFGSAGLATSLMMHASTGRWFAGAVLVLAAGIGLVARRHGKI